MISVEQRRLWRPDDHPDGPQRGDCLAACVASIFEVPYEDCAEIDGDTETVRAWLTARYPGLSVSYRIFHGLDDCPERIGDHVNWPTHHWEQGYWIASVWSPRIPDRETFDCGCAYDSDNQPKPPDPDCRWCHGEPHKRSMGITWGLHAVVMRGARLAWDPHPSRDPNAGLYFAGAVTFVVTDPALLGAWPR